MAGYIGKGQPLVSNGAERKFKYVATAGQTVFNATYSVGSVHVYRTGVRLTDGVDYTATNGSTVTLTTGCNAGDDVVIVSTSGFQVADAYTKAELANHDLVTVDASGHVGVGTTSTNAVYPLIVSRSGGSGMRAEDGVNTADFVLVGTNSYVSNNNANGDTIFWNGSAERMRIDSAGRVTMPYQPSFHVWRSDGNVSIGAGSNKITMNGVTHNEGNHFNTSTQRFTAPVAGLYHFSAGHNAYSGSGVFRVQLAKNGGSVFSGTQITLGSSSDHVALLSTSIKLNAGDYVEIYAYSNNGYSTSGNSSMWNWFTGYLLG